MTLKWMADRLKMGTWTHVTNRLCRQKNDSMFLSQYQLSMKRLNVIKS